MQDHRNLPEPIDADIAEFGEFLKNTLGQAIVDAQNIHFDNRDAQHVLVVCLYATILQAAHDCSIFLDEETVTIVGGALRGKIESWADLTNMIADKNYGQRMSATFAHEKERYFQNMLKSPQNPFFVAMAKQVNPQTCLEAAQAELDKLAAGDFKPLTNEKRLAMSGQADIYQGSAPLCCRLGIWRMTAQEI